MPEVDRIARQDVEAHPRSDSPAQHHAAFTAFFDRVQEELAAAADRARAAEAELAAAADRARAAEARADAAETGAVFVATFVPWRPLPGDRLPGPEIVAVCGTREAALHACLADYRDACLPDDDRFSPGAHRECLVDGAYRIHHVQRQGVAGEDGCEPVAPDHVWEEDGHSSVFHDLLLAERSAGRVA